MKETAGQVGSVLARLSGLASGIDLPGTPGGGEAAVELRRQITVLDSTLRLHKEWYRHPGNRALILNAAKKNAKGKGE